MSLQQDIDTAWEAMQKTYIAAQSLELLKVEQQDLLSIIEDNLRAAALLDRQRVLQPVRDRLTRIRELFRQQELGSYSLEVKRAKEKYWQDLPGSTPKLKE